MDLAYAPHELEPAEEHASTPSSPAPEPEAVREPTPEPAPAAPGAATSSSDDAAADVPKQASSTSSAGSTEGSATVGQEQGPGPAEAGGEKIHQPGSPTSSSSADSRKDSKEGNKPSAPVRASAEKSSASEDTEESWHSGSSGAGGKTSTLAVPGGEQTGTNASDAGPAPRASTDPTQDETLSTPPAASGIHSRRARSISDPDSPTPASSSSEAEDDTQSLKIVNRVAKLPVVECTMKLYEMLKFNNFTGWAIQLTEGTVKMVASPFVYMVSPFLSLCRPPVNCVDATLCVGLDGLETVLPCIKVYPNQMCAATTSCITNCVCCCPRAVSAGAKKICPKI